MGEVDFEGQKLAERLYTWIITVAGVLGTIAGFILQDFRITFLAIVAGTLISLLICVPAWPFLSLNPIKFLPVPVESESTAILSSSSGSHRKKKKKD